MWCSFDLYIFINTHHTQTNKNTLTHTYRCLSVFILFYLHLFSDYHDVICALIVIVIHFFFTLDLVNIKNQANEFKRFTRKQQKKNFSILNIFDIFILKKMRERNSHYLYLYSVCYVYNWLNLFTIYIHSVYNVDIDILENKKTKVVASQVNQFDVVKFFLLFI